MRSIRDLIAKRSGFCYPPSVCRLGKVPDASREFFRFFAPTERLALQGFMPKIILDFPTTKLAIKAAGNAYPVPLIIATTHGIIKAISDAVSESRLDILNWPPVSATQNIGLPHFLNALRAPPRNIRPKAKAKAKAKAKVLTNAKAKAMKRKRGERSYYDRQNE